MHEICLRICPRSPFLADTMRTEVAYLLVHAFGRGAICIENTSCHVFIHNKTPKDSYFVVWLTYTCTCVL